MAAGQVHAAEQDRRAYNLVDPEVLAEEHYWNSSYVIEYLESLVLSSRLSERDVLLMDEGRPRERTRTTFGYINPMQGRRPDRPSDSRLYPGDRNIHNGRVQL